MKKIIALFFIICSISQLNIFADANIQEDVKLIVFKRNGTDIISNYSAFGTLIITSNMNVIIVRVMNNVGIDETFRLSALINNNYVFAEHFRGGMLSAGNLNATRSTFSISNDIYILRIYQNQNIIYEIHMQKHINEPEQQSNSVIGFRNNDVFIAGHYSQGFSNNSQVILQKNNEYYELTNGTTKAFAWAMYIIDSFVIIGGEEDNIAKYWMVNITTGIVSSSSLTNELKSSVYSICVGKGDLIFFAGESKNNAVYWELNPVTNNIREHKLTNGTNNSRATSIITSNDVIYITGYEGKIAKYWRNNIETALTDGTKNAEASAIYISGSNIYIAGFEGNEAKYWKDGLPVTVTSEVFSSTLYSFFGSGNDDRETTIVMGGLTSIFVSGSDIYYTGSLNRFASYWKNGNPVDVSNGNKVPVQIAPDRSIDIQNYFSSVIDMDISGGDIACIIESGSTSLLYQNGVYIPLQINATALKLIRK